MQDAAKTSWWARHKEQIERYGGVAVAVIFGLFLAEMVVLVGLLRLGVDLTPFVSAVASWTGVDLSGVMEAAGTIGIAYAITRILKPFQLLVAAILTPPIAAALGKDPGPALDEAPETSPPA